MHSPGPEHYRLAVIFQRPHVYFCQFLQVLAARPELDVTAYFYSTCGIGSTPDPDLGRSLRSPESSLSGYHARILKNRSPRPDLARFWGLFHPGLIREISPRYDALMVHGWWGLSSWLAYFTALARSVPVLVHSDRSYGQGRTRPERRPALRWLFRHASGFLVIGKRNGEFYRHLGVDAARMFPTPLAVDNQFYQTAAARLTPQRDALRQKLGIAHSDFVILNAGRLAPEKGLMDLLLAFKTLAANHAHLLLVGDGREGRRLRDFVAAHRLERVHFLGTKTYEELPEYYAMADVFVLPSYIEPWAVVVNEAMNFALPVIASQQVGAADDLVKDGVNGFRFDAGDTGALATILRRMVDTPEICRKMGGCALPIIREWNLERAAEGVLAALRSLTARREDHKA